MKKLVQILIAITYLTPFSNAQNSEWLVRPIYDAISPFYDGVAVVKRDGRWGYINEEGKEIIEMVNGHVYNFSENVGVVSSVDNTVTAIIDTKGAMLKPQRKLKIDPRFPVFSDGLLLVTDGKAWGYMNKNGEMPIPCQYLYAKPFSEGLAGVLRTNEGWFFINASNQVVIPCELNKEKYWVSGFNNGNAFAMYKSGLVRIDKSGKIIEYKTNIFPPTNNQAYFEKTFPCSGGELFFDTKNRVISINENSGKNNQYADVEGKVHKGDGYFILNGNQVSFNSPTIFWNNLTMATVTYSGKVGIVLQKDNPVVSIDYPEFATSVLGNPAELKLIVSNNSLNDIDSAVFKLDGTNQLQIKKIKKGEKKELIYLIPKETDLDVENKNTSLSVYDNGLLISKFDFKIQIKDITVLQIEFPNDRIYEINENEKIDIPIKLLNKSPFPANDINVIIRKNSRIVYSKTIEIVANGIKRIDLPIFENISTNEMIEVLLKSPKTPLIKSEVFNFKIIINEIHKDGDGANKKYKNQDSKNVGKTIEGVN